MTEQNPTTPHAALPAVRGETAVSREIPFSLVWLKALDPRIFTPTTWTQGYNTRIRLMSPDGSVDVGVYRAILLYLDGNTGLQDEIHSHHENEGSQFNYEFGPEPERKLIKHNPNPSMSEHMQKVVRSLSELVTIPGATIEAHNLDSGPESSFISDGTQWIDRGTGLPAPTVSEITVSQPLVEPSGSE